MVPRSILAFFGRSQNWLFPTSVILLAIMAGTINAISQGIIDKILTSKSTFNILSQIPYEKLNMRINHMILYMDRKLSNKSSMHLQPLFNGTICNLLNQVANCSRALIHQWKVLKNALSAHAGLGKYRVY